MHLALKQGGAVGQIAGQTKVLRQRRPHIGKGCRRPQPPTRWRRWSEEQHRDLFARVVGAGPGRIVAVVCCPQHQIIRPQDPQQLRQSTVPVFQRFSIALG